MGQWFQLPRFVICVLYYWPSIFTLLFCFLDFIFLPYWDNIHHTTTGLSLWIEIIIADRGTCFCSCVTVSWTALNMKVGLEGRTRRIAMVSTFKIWWQNTLVHVFHILGSGSGDGETFWSWAIYLRRYPLLTKLSIHFINKTLNYPARRACALRALGLLLADGAPTVGGGKTFWAVSQIFLRKQL